MSPCPFAFGPGGVRFPRVSGDEPLYQAVDTSGAAFFPRERG